MAGCTKTSDLSGDIGGPSFGAGLDRRVRGGRAQTTRWCGMPSACKAMALALALVVGGSVQALAQDPPNQEANKVWGGCSLDPATVSELETDIEAGGIPNAKVDFIVVYSQENPNNGQKRSGPGYTGPVICTNPNEVDITAFDKNGEAGGVRLSETTDIPTQTDAGGAMTVDILSAEEAFVLQHKLKDGSNTGEIQNRVCHTTDANVDCFLIFPP